MLSVSDLRDARPGVWRDAGDDALATARRCDHMASVARDEVARGLTDVWRDPNGDSARRRFAGHADDYESAAVVLRSMTKAYDALADAIENAQRTLISALDYASRHRLTVHEDGSVTTRPVITTPDGSEERNEHMREAHELVVEALRAASEADATSADTLRVIALIPDHSDPQTVRKALSEGADSPLGIAMRLRARPDGLHKINVPPEQIEAAKRASRETGVSMTLLLAILWQEQQGYQNGDPSLRGWTTAAGRLFNWVAGETVKPDKSHGITHMKLATARQVIKDSSDAFRLPDGRDLNSLSDAQLRKYLEENPNEDIRLSAHYLAQLRREQYGTTSDKALFMLYAADTDQVRDGNAQHGDDSGPRRHAIRGRADNWDAMEPHLRDAQAWGALSDEQRRGALDALAKDVPDSRKVDLDPLYDESGVESETRGRKPAPPQAPGLAVPPPDDLYVPPPPDQPSPAPGPAPAAPGSGG